MTAIHKSNLYHSHLKPNNHARHQPRIPRTAKAENRSSCSIKFRSMNDAMVNLLKMATHVFQAKVKLQSIVCLRSMGRAPESPLSMGPERPRYAAGKHEFLRQQCRQICGVYLFTLHRTRKTCTFLKQT